MIRDGIRRNLAKGRWIQLIPLCMELFCAGLFFMNHPHLLSEILKLQHFVLFSLVFISVLLLGQSGLVAICWNAWFQLRQEEEKRRLRESLITTTEGVWPPAPNVPQDQAP